MFRVPQAHQEEHKLTAVSKPTAALAVATVIFSLVAPASFADDKSSTIATLVDRAVRPIMQEHDIPGMAVAVTMNGQQYVFTYGVTSKASKTPVTKETLFELGSVSKTFTTTLAGYAQALGKLSLDDHPGKYLPQLRGSALDQATLLNLGTYTTGLPLHLPDELSNLTKVTAYLRNWKPSSPPGVQRRYSNPSIGLFGHLAATAMNRPFADLMEFELFPKLGLNQTYIHVPKAKMESYAWGHDKANKPIRVAPAVFGEEAYGVKSSAADMIRMVESNIQPEELEPALRSAVEGTHVGYFEVGPMVQGLGWEQYPYPVALDRLLAGNATQMAMKPQRATRLTPPRQPSAPILFNKTGSTNGFSTYVAFVPAERIGIVMLANKNVASAPRVAAAHAVLQELLKLNGKRGS